MLVPMLEERPARTRAPRQSAPPAITPDPTTVVAAEKSPAVHQRRTISAALRDAPTMGADTTSVHGQASVGTG